MSENKKYFYLKLKDSFFSSEEMLVLESVPNGMIYQNIYLRMCLLSLKNEGALTFKNMLPYDLKMLATVLRVDISQMKMALELFEQLGLVTKTDNEVLFMSDIQALIGQSSTEAERIAKYRKRIAESNNVNEILPDKECTKSVQMLQSCTPKIELELEKKKELELEKKKENTVKAKVTPLILNDNTEWLPTVKEYEEYKTLYPNVDIETQFRKMRGWLNGNPTKRKTRKGITRFVNNWLSNEQDKPQVNAPKQRSDWSGQATDEEYMAGASNLDTIGF